MRPPRKRWQFWKMTFDLHQNLEGSFLLPVDLSHLSCVVPDQFQIDFYQQFKLDNRVGCEIRRTFSKFSFLVLFVLHRLFLLTAGLLLVSGIYDTMNDNANGDSHEEVR